jgi:methionyl-tRNA formyltransferase
VRTVYLGTSDFAAVVLDRLFESEHRPALVVSRPDRKKGRGRKLSPPPVVERARELGIDVFQPDKVNDPESRARIMAVEPAAIAICAYGAIIGDELLAAHQWFNVHPSLLPRWRGAAPIERAIDAGDDKTGVSIMEPIAELDAGPVYLMREEPIEPGDDYGSLAARLAQLGGDLLVEALDKRPERKPQTSDGITYAEKIERDERRLDPAQGADAVLRRVRALNPHVGTFVELADGERLTVRRAAPSEETLSAGELAAQDGRLLLGATGGAIELIEVQSAGGKPMAAADWLRGRPGVAGAG